MPCCLTCRSERALVREPRKEDQNPGDRAESRQVQPPKVCAWQQCRTIKAAQTAWALRVSGCRPRCVTKTVSTRLHGDRRARVVGQGEGAWHFCAVGVQGCWGRSQGTSWTLQMREPAAHACLNRGTYCDEDREPLVLRGENAAWRQNAGVNRE